MDYNAQKFWDGYKNELIDPVELLIKNKYDQAAVKLILSGIDSLAGYYTGRVSPGSVGNSFMEFVERYMPNFNKVLFPNSPTTGLINRKTGHVIIKPSEIFYHIFRNDMIHDGSLGIGVEVYRDKDVRILWKGQGFQIFRINIFGLFEYFKKAVNDYDHDLDLDSDLQMKFADKHNDVFNLSFGS